jgi:hypothetical protein
MTQAQLKACTAKVRRAAVEDCDTPLKPKGQSWHECSNKANHLWPIPTGFCNSGWCEGFKVDKPTCKFWVNCPCNCHTNLSRMFAMSGQGSPLRPIDNSTYVPDRGGFVRVSLDELVEKTITEDPHVRVVASPAPGLVPTIVEKSFAPTPTGRAGRGQLESWVREVTDLWALGPDGNCTPQYVADKIMKLQGLERGPSTGAIDAVFRRWESIGFAFIKSKPTRFAGYTPDGIKLGLEVLKAKGKAKRG